MAEVLGGALAEQILKKTNSQQSHEPVLMRVDLNIPVPRETH